MSSVKEASHRRIYFDYNATSPVLPEVLERLVAWAENLSGNPSSIHASGRTARYAIEESRETLARFLNAEDPECIIFTSGATEANWLALTSSLNRKATNRVKIVCSAIEHPSVLQNIKHICAANDFVLEL